MTDKLTAWLRTVVPSAWAALVTWLIASGAPEWVTAPLGESGAALVLPLVLGATYAIMRKVEPMLPPLLTQILLGSNREPVYPSGEMSAPRDKVALY